MNWGRGVFWAIPINLLGFQLVNLTALPDVDFKALLWLLSGHDVANPQYIDAFTNSIYTHPSAILLYVIFVNALSLALGLCCHLVVRGWHLDLKIQNGSDSIMNGTTCFLARPVCLTWSERISTENWYVLPSLN